MIGKYSEIVSRLDSVLQYDFTQVYFNSEIKDQFKVIARETVGLERECRACIEQAYNQMIKLRHSISVLMAEGKKENQYTLQLPKGQTHVSHGGIVINNDNFSDEAAEKMVAINPDYAKYFKGLSEAKAKQLAAARKKEIEESRQRSAQRATANRANKQGSTLVKEVAAEVVAQLSEQGKK